MIRTIALVLTAVVTVPCIALGQHAGASRVGGTQATRYVNARYGFYVAVPATFVPQGESDNGDGQAFASRDGKAEVRAFGANLLEPDIPCSAESVFAKKSPKVTYTHRSKDASTVSGTFGDEVFYTKVMRTKDRCLTLTIRYPAAQRKIYDPEMAALASSFQD